MNNKKIIEALNVTIKGLSMLRDEFENGATTTTPVEAINAPEAPVADEAPVTTGDVDVEVLKKMKYNEFKKYASKLGVDCKGTRDEIMSRVLEKIGAESTPEEEVDETPVVEETPVKSDSSKPSKKLGKAKTSEPTRDEFDEQAEEIAKDTDVEEIIEALADVDVKATKKNAVEKLAYALREGLIELDADSDDDSDDDYDDEDTEVEDDTEASAEDDGDSEDDEITSDTYTDTFDPNGYNDPKVMSAKRKKAIKNKMQEILDAIESEDLTEDDITSYIEDNATEEEIELRGDDYEDEDLIRFYMELIKRTIDNDGEEHEPSDPYELGDELNFCCGHELKYSKNTKKYICEVCGEEYEAE